MGRFKVAFELVIWGAYLVIWSTTWFTCVPPLTVQIELTKLTCMPMHENKPAAHLSLTSLKQLQCASELAWHIMAV